MTLPTEEALEKAREEIESRGNFAPQTLELMTFILRSPTMQAIIRGYADNLGRLFVEPTPNPNLKKLMVEGAVQGIFGYAFNVAITLEAQRANT